MKKPLFFVTGLLTGIFITGFLSKAVQPDPAPALSHSRNQFAKSQRKVLIDNNRVQVIDYYLKPGDKTLGMHTHQYPHVDVLLAGGSVLVKNLDGTAAQLTAQTNSVYYRPGGVTHAPVNIGHDPIHMIEVHVK